jgi:hypothetical protein
VPEIPTNAGVDAREEIGAAVHAEAARSAEVVERTTRDAEIGKRRERAIGPLPRYPAVFVS